MKKLFMVLALIAISFAVNNAVYAQRDTCHCTTVKKLHQTKKAATNSATASVDFDQTITVYTGDSTKTKPAAEKPETKTAENGSGGGNTGLILGIVALVAIVAIALAGRRYFGGNANNQNDVNLINAVGNNGGYLHVTEANGRSVVLSMNQPSATTVQLRQPQTIRQA